MFRKLQKMVASEGVRRLANVVSTLALFGIVGCMAQLGSSEPSRSGTSGSSAYQSVLLLEGLENPWGIAWLPNGDMLITERPGRVRLVQDGALTAEPIPGVPPLFAENQGGLLDIALHPQFEENRLVYFTYSDGTNSANRTRIARATYSGDALSDWDVIFEVDRAKQSGQHFGSRLVWLPDGTLLASIGDGGNPPLERDGEFIRQQAQNLGSHLGKTIRINDNGSVPADNPFADNSEAEPEVWSYGHRNIQGLAFDTTRNQVWASEHGSRGGDEVNQLAAGVFGWVDFAGNIAAGDGRPEGDLDAVDCAVWVSGVCGRSLS